MVIEKLQMKPVFFPVTILFFIFSCSNLFSQNVFDVRSMSMGNTSVSNSYDIDAFNQNPANILNQRLNKNSLIYFNLFTNAGLFTSSDYLSLDFYDDYFTKDDNGNTRYLNDNDKANILNEASNQQSNYLASAKILSFILNTKNSGSFGLSIYESTNGNFIPGRDFLELVLNGNEANTTYNLS
ncbi:MAG: hypothetical protein IPL53_08555 [Ignavibacteria bacterium]|nr:hypothetical protein [Ignavibacteria bacterium]